MASFEAFLPKLLRFEGGFVNDPADPGGATNKGITLRTFQGCSRQLLQLEPTLDNLRHLTDEQAARIYKCLYWDRLGADQLQCQELAEMLVDFYVNAGGHATRVLQATLNDIGARPLLSVDGVFGPATRRALQNFDHRDLYARLRGARIAYYQQLAERRPPLKRFLAGWLNRVNAFPMA